MLPDYLGPHLAVVFVGTSVSTTSARRGHYYSGQGNKFWEFLWEAGLTGNRILSPEQDALVLEFGIGLTDLAKATASSSDSGLRTSDYNLLGFVSKMEEFEPKLVAFNGIEAARRVSRYLHEEAQPALGPAPWRIGKSRAYVLPSSSGSNADPKNYAPMASKVQWWRELGRHI